MLSPKTILRSNRKRSIFLIVTLSLVAVVSSACLNRSLVKVDDIPLDKISLPAGFHIDVFAEGVEGARSMVLGAEGTLFVGTRSEGKVYAIKDLDNDFKADEIITIAEKLKSPNGVAFRDGALYVAEISKVWRYDDIEQQLGNIPSPRLVNDGFPDDGWHGWKYIAFGPDGKLYVPVGAPCNICEKKDERYASIMRMNSDGSDLEVYAHGVRNSVGFAWHPETQEMWFTNNGRDMLGDDIPNDELNHAPEPNLHFGFPYCHAGDIPDPRFGEKRDCKEFVPPAQKLAPHTAALGMKFYTGAMFPSEYEHQIFIAEHGSWNRTEPIGYRITQVKLYNNKATSYTPFAEGWLEDGKAWGRPVDILLLPDGSMLVSDDYANVIYRIWYES